MHSISTLAPVFGIDLTTTVERAGLLSCEKYP
jgi:hypothetical protein